MKRIMIAVAVSAVLTGCMNSLKTASISSTTGSSIDIYSGSVWTEMNGNRIADDKLRIVTPSDNASGGTLAVLTAMTFNFSTRSFDKENYKGSAIESMPNPTDIYFTPKAKQSISKWMAENTNGYKYEQHLSIGYATWALIYKETAAVPLYQLKYKVIFYKRPEGGTLLSAFTDAECAPTPAEATLAEWSKDGYAKVTQQTQAYMDSCLLELNNQLPRLLKK